MPAPEMQAYVRRGRRVTRRLCVPLAALLAALTAVVWQPVPQAAQAATLPTPTLPTPSLPTPSLPIVGTRAASLSQQFQTLWRRGMDAEPISKKPKETPQRYGPTEWDDASARRGTMLSLRIIATRAGAHSSNRFQRPFTLRQARAVMPNRKL